MRSLLMVDRYDPHGDVEAEPLIASVDDGMLRLELDDGSQIEVLLDDLLAAVSAVAVDGLREAA